MTPARLVAPLAFAATSVTAHSQPIVTYSISWTDVLPSGNPFPPPNGRVDPGEGVRLAIRVTIEPGIGSTVTYAPPPPPGVGTIAGFGSMFLDILGTNLSGGTWSNINRNPGFNWSIGEPGTGQPNGNLFAAQAGQFPYPGMTANSSNPIVNIWRGTWNPASYAPRTVSFATAPAAAAAGNHSSVLVQFGTGSMGEPRYVYRFVDGVFGETGAIPIVPSPPSLLVLLPAMLGGAGRRRPGTRGLA